MKSIFKIIAVGAIFLSSLYLVPTQLAAKSKIPTSQPQITLSYAPLVKRIAPAVVNVYASQKNCAALTL